MDFRAASTWAVTEAPSPGMLPATGSSSSPENTVSYVRSRSSLLSECGALSGIANTGSPGFKPSETSIRRPSEVSIRPRSASGRLAHWYFLMPP